ncbi:unnamed protein product [Candidula unifasciata]|uniref:Mannan endo-1,4-beta-mannosidase n=1 Tax=Candidula unifasciata TaxID=100452 RepID=A0A8S3YSL9_9EUPU|nr:unnamed protein product [Candidula unifasciata]
MKTITALLFTALVSLGVCERLKISGDHFTYKGEKVFLSGGNLPWISYAYDFGNGQWAGVKSRAEEQIKLLSEAGGNSLRLWIHIQGETSPNYDSNGNVIGLDAKGTFLDDFKDLLDLAKKYNIFAFPTLWNGAVNQDGQNHLNGLVTDAKKLQTYLDKALTPLVQAVKGHPALGGWDIINEIEGMVIPGRKTADKCYDTTALANSGAGWAGNKYNYEDVLRFVNWQAAAIKSADPESLVSVGVWNPRSNTDQFGQVNHYSDECLVKAGGKANGKLDFWQFHSYDWQGQFDDVSPFKHSYADYKVDRPILIGEFWEKGGGGLKIAELFEYIYNHGYAGAWSWDLVNEGGNQRPGIAHIKSYTKNGKIPVTIS